MFAVKDAVRYKLAVDLEHLEEELNQDENSDQPAASQSSQASGITQAAAGWRFKSSRAVVTGRGEIEANIGDTIYTIEMQV